MPGVHHVKASQHHLKTGLLNVFSAIVTQTSLMVVLQRTQELLDKHQNLGDSDVDALGMHGLGNQDCEGNKSLPHPSFCEPPVLEQYCSISMLTNRNLNGTTGCTCKSKI